jgi:mono/diheme cytochrome c family protein
LEKISQMKTGKIQILKGLGALRFSVLLAILLFANGDLFAQEGKALFEANCAKCHHPVKGSTGPALQGARARWEENAGEGKIYDWVKNSQAMIDAGEPYAVSLKAEWKTVMTNFPQFSKEQMDAIFDYTDEYVEEVVSVGNTEGVTGEAQSDSGSSWVWWVIASISVIVILYVGSVKRQLSDAIAEQNGTANDVPQTLSERVRDWAWRNRVFVGIGGLVGLIVALTALLIWGNETVGIYEGYKPSQPIEFSHKIHAGEQGIACQYCHNTVEKSKSASVPTVNVCMNCHKAIPEGKVSGTEEIAKIYDAAGFDGRFYTNDSKPIVWNKVHVLPDHVFFSHMQHVVVGGVDCKQCHGDMTKETVAKIQSIEDLNAVEGNIKLHRPTLTMGWCIECHGEKGVAVKGGTAYYQEIHNRLVKNRPELLQKYLEDDKISVEELGGWECAKCHY